ncbi:hypothetical protein D3C76_715960 [compost metagenome]
MLVACFCFRRRPTSASTSGSLASLEPACDAVFSEYPAAIAASRFVAPDSKASTNRRFLSVKAMVNFS